MVDVVLVDESGKACGRADRLTVHTDHTPLHLAFSCYVTSPEGDLLITRRSLDKLTWPGVWTNSCCGHPQPGEDLAAAVVRRCREELGIEVAGLHCVLPDFRYRATDLSGIIENEVCPVFLATTLDVPRPDPLEVADWRWSSWAQVSRAVAATPFAFSPWMALQVPLVISVTTPSPPTPVTS